ncbi:bifunctional phosphoglucose/phosphomannose isomerase [Taibaiella soli]|uniref:Bifunctional phosphoglucose/phosphomannose isomerase n=1 Tax=Taibaiella soli TaxID=1649169 RepID=A0A2W2AB90_9BACT|nr:bifunctional phosphoglucose/phosphomannose isomerase [Taibaiella soli]PZF70872.1 bifunctional phosphoglucose/phosphomannose isomerase [Taibaiella soli]
MKELIADFPVQLEEALIIGQNYHFLSARKTFSNIVLTGLGGSGIGGSIIQNFLGDKAAIPFIVNKDYTLPAFVGENTLVLVSSYSGNTEETVACLQQALKAKATIVCVTSGGKVAEVARKKKVDCILLPAGMPPRACLGYSIVQVLFALQYHKLLKGDFEKDILASIKLLKNETGAIQKSAKAIAKKLNGKIPVIYTAPNFEGVAVRFRQQINENGKMLAWHNVIPEMNHNELVGWRDKNDNLGVVMLRNESDYSRVQMRMDSNKKVIKKYTSTIIEIFSQGKSYWEKIFYFVHLTDWVSVYLADLHGVDATEVKVIDSLKGELNKA